VDMRVERQDGQWSLSALLVSEELLHLRSELSVWAGVSKLGSTLYTVCRISVSVVLRMAFDTYNFRDRSSEIGMEGGGRISIFALKVSIFLGLFCGELTHVDV
jgi:hypothetical protein